jgi:DNA replication and repair protein RecF
MVFTDIRLQNFRSYSDSSFELGPGVNIVVGPNTAGKTNLLEAIMVSATGRSFRAKDSELTKKSKNWARIDTHTKDNRQRTTKLKIEQNKLLKEFELDGKNYKRMPAELAQPVVLFEPNHLFLFHDEPGKRRNFLDNLIEQTDPVYSQTLNRYKRTLYQRNALLKQRGAKKQIFVWDIKLVDLAGKIVQKRVEMIEMINKKITKTYQKIASGKYKIKMSYSSEIGIKDYGSSLLKRLGQSIDKDIERGHTSEGPHRDDFGTTINGQSITSVASRGEIRSLLLALKTIEAETIEKNLGKKPLLLLDDVFSELDGMRRKALTDFIKGHQAIITTTDADVVTKNFSQTTQVIPLG